MNTLRTISATVVILLFYVKFLLFRIWELEGTPITILDIFSYLFCLLSIDFRHVKYNIFWVFVFLGLSVFVSSARTLAFLFLILYALKDISIRQIAAANLFCSIAIFAYLIFSIQLGLITDQVLITANGTERYDLGMKNPNILGLFAYGLCSNLYVLWGNRHKFITFSLISLFGTWVYIHSGSRTFLFSIVLLLGLYLSYNNKHLSSPLFNKRMIMWLPFIFTGMTLLMAIAVQAVPALDILFSFRFSYYNQLLTGSSGLQLLIGNPMIDEIVIDSSYMHMAFRAGLLGYTLFAYIYYKGIKNTFGTDKYIFPLVISTLCYGITESLLFYTVVFNNMILWIFLFQHATNTFHNSSYSLKHENRLLYSEHL